MRPPFDARFLVPALSRLLLGPATPLAAAERAAVFKAAGFEQQGDAWRRCDEETPTASSMPGAIELTDSNGDGAPEAVVTESSLFCYGHDSRLPVYHWNGTTYVQSK